MSDHTGYFVPIFCPPPSGAAVVTPAVLFIRDEADADILDEAGAQIEQES